MDSITSIVIQRHCSIWNWVWHYEITRNHWNTGYMYMCCQNTFKMRIKRFELTRTIDPRFVAMPNLDFTSWSHKTFIGIYCSLHGPASHHQGLWQPPATQFAILCRPRSLVWTAAVRLRSTATCPSPHSRRQNRRRTVAALNVTTLVYRRLPEVSDARCRRSRPTRCRFSSALVLVLPRPTCSVPPGRHCPTITFVYYRRRILLTRRSASVVWRPARCVADHTCLISWHRLGRLTSAFWRRLSATCRLTLTIKSGSHCIRSNTARPWTLVVAWLTHTVSLSATYHVHSCLANAVDAVAAWIHVMYTSYCIILVKQVPLDYRLGFVGKWWIRIFGHRSIRIFEYLRVRDIMFYKKTV